MYILFHNITLLYYRPTTHYNAIFMNIEVQSENVNLMCRNS